MGTRKRRCSECGKLRRFENGHTRPSNALVCAWCRFRREQARNPVCTRLRITRVCVRSRTYKGQPVCACDDVALRANSACSSSEGAYSYPNEYITYTSLVSACSSPACALDTSCLHNSFT